MSSLFFVAGQENESVPYRNAETIREHDGLSVPLLIRHRTKHAPLVATEIDYFYFRNLQLSQGDLFTLPGDVVVGGSIAEKHQLKLGDKVKIQSNDMYDLTKSPPIDLVVTGILQKSASPDDAALFTGLRTIWILEGFLHSHSDQDPYKEETESETTYSKSLNVKQKMTEENLLDFHFHESISELPITHVIYRGNTHKSEVLLMNSMNQDQQLMAFRPADSMEGVINIFLRLEEFLKSYHLFWSLCTLIMIALIFGLIVQSRKEEFSVLVSLGASKNLVFSNISQLITIYVALAALLAVFWFYLMNYLLRAYIP